MKTKNSKTSIKTLSNSNVSRISKANSTNRLNTDDLKSDKFYVFKGTGNSRFMLTKINEEDEFKKFSPKRHPHRYSLLDYKNNHHMTDIHSLGLGNHNSGTEKWHENNEKNLRKIHVTKKIDKLNSSLIKKSISLENYNIYKSKRLANSNSSLGKAKKFSVILDYRNKNK